MKTYLGALQQVLENGTVKEDRTGTGTISLFGMQQRYDLSKGFPAVTTKKLAWRAVVSELLWFIEGSGDERRLREILHGSRDSEKSTIWTDNATASYWQDRSRFEGDLGRVYGVQWRHWRTHDEMGNAAESGRAAVRTVRYEIDQLLNLIDNIKKDPYGRRHILSAWNVGEIDKMALPPCHVMSQFYVSDGRLSCQMYQRSCDMFLGVPFNIASYSLLTHMIAQVCNLAVGEFVHVLGDAHIYLNHIQQVNEQLKREPLPAPQLWLNPNIKNITEFTMADIRLDNYTSHSAIQAEMAI
jgi:thymidylate synthase